PEQCLGGKPDAPVRIEVFSDYECNSCRTLYLDVIRKVLDDYSSQNRVCVVYYEFPLWSRGHGRVAARYSKAAQRLGLKQWRAVMDALYANQDRWTWNGSVDAIVSRALTSEDFSRLRKMLEEASIDSAIQREIAVGKRREVRFTPTFYVYLGGKAQRVEGIIPYRVMKRFLDRVFK
ncbi:MAG: thioredoxin domain-containing protein, partial [Acidobacteria bacterium]|nr:thioredoxin domain-containing protein [Acidobacteriota bacterium]